MLRPLVAATTAAVTTVYAVLLAATPAHAAVVLTLDVITWDVVGIDSNDPATGPTEFPVAGRVCNTGSDPAPGATVSFAWTGTNDYLAVTAPTTISVGTLDPGECRDAYFEVVVDPTLDAIGTSRSYVLTATATGATPVTSGTDHQIYVEALISQNRNAVTSITGPTTVYVGEAYEFTLVSETATNGYEQLESFLNFPPGMIELIAVETTYTAPTGGTNDSVYADGCGWDYDPASPTYLTCVGPEGYSGGKAGGSIVTTYTVRIVGTGTTTLTALIYDMSGSSYHYNTDFGDAPNLITVTAHEPPDVAVVKSHAAPFVRGGAGVWQLVVTNVGGSATTGPVTLTDTLPAGVTYAGFTGSGWTCAISGQLVTCTYAGLLAPGGTATLTLHVDVAADAPLSVTNVATVDTPNDPNEENDRSTDAAPVPSPAPTLPPAPPTAAPTPPGPGPTPPGPGGTAGGPTLPHTAGRDAATALIVGLYTLAGGLACLRLSRRLSRRPTPAG